MVPEGGLHKCIIVDDEAIVRNDLKRLIDWEAAGFTIVGEASNGKDGIALFYSLQPELVITDIKMPIMDGLEMVKTLSESTGGSVVFFIFTAFEDFGFAKAAIDFNVNKYLLKYELNGKAMLSVLSSAKAQIEEHKQARKIRRKQESDMICGAVSNKIAMAIQYIHENFAHDISLTDVSSRLSMSELYFGQLFKKETGTREH